ncbi:MAG: hypothetical protein M3468_01625 [Acidobacteriota bacterium]|nr:hypothetical protein [Acidobacteriota bacterium]
MSSLRSVRAAWLTLLLIILATGQSWAQGFSLTVEAPASLETVAERIRSLDRGRLADALARAGLPPPLDARITLVPEDDARAQASPTWVAAQAFGSREVVIFPARIGSYPYNSLETVVWHEVVHLALSARAGGRPLPRWFHEGVAMSVESGWGLDRQLRLLVNAAADPSLADLNQLFASDTQPDNAAAYLLAAALVSDVRRTHGAEVPGEVAARVAGGMPFRQAFAAVTGEVPETSADRAWASYRRWASWLPVVTGAGFLWLLILPLAALAFFASLRRRARQRRRWEEEELREEAKESARRKDFADSEGPEADLDDRDERKREDY